MRVFEKFNSKVGDPCPVCNSRANAPTVLVPISGTEKDGNMEAMQVHKECFDLIHKMERLESKDNG